MMPEVSEQGVRILIAGNAQDNTLLYECLEAQGFHIVGDYHWLGDNCCARDIEVLGDPLIAITEHYQKYSLTSRRFPQSNDELIALAKKSGAQGVVFFLFEAEEALSWDVPGQSRAVENAGIPALVLGEQPYGPRVDTAFQEMVAAFKARVTK